MPFTVLWRPLGPCTHLVVMSCKFPSTYMPFCHSPLQRHVVASFHEHPCRSAVNARPRPRRTPSHPTSPSHSSEEPPFGNDLSPRDARDARANERRAERTSAIDERRQRRAMQARLRRAAARSQGLPANPPPLSPRGQPAPIQPLNAPEGGAVPPEGQCPIIYYLLTALC